MPPPFSLHPCSKAHCQVSASCMRQLIMCPPPPAAADLCFASPAPSPPLCRAGNVAWEADDKALARLFEPCGVVKVRLHTDKDTGKPKGFAHVHFK